MIYLLGVAFVASRCSAGPSILASVLSVAAFDFFFVPPMGTFAVEDIEYIFTFIVMLVVSLLISSLSVSVREEARRRGEATLRAESERLRGDLLSLVSHDLRTPLAAIEGSAEAIMQSGTLAEADEQLALTIQDESRRMGRLIRNLLDMTRVQDRLAPDYDWYGVDELVESAVDRTRSLFRTRPTIRKGSEVVIARVDGVLIEQVIVNLLENAARHAGSEAVVQIEISRKGDAWELSVSDNGPGVSKEAAEVVFDRFHRGHSGGMGLGLAICRSIVLAHHGKIWVEESTLGGARFVFRLPVEPEVGDE